MDNDTSSSVYDPVLDTSLELTRSRQPAVPVEFVGQHQQLVVNPLVAMLSGVSAAVLIRHGLHTRNVLLFCAGLGVLFLSFLLIQFHCRDCGSTGWYLHASRHACAAVVARWRQNVVPRYSLTAKRQLHIWSYALVFGLLGYAVFLLSRM